MKKQQLGLTLIELMIAMLVGILVTGAVITVFVTNIKATTENIKMVRLNQELRIVTNMLSDELKRAGYSASADDDGYMLAFETIDQNANGVADCVIYAYDRDANGSAYSAASDRNGFRFDAATNTVLFGQSITSCSAPATNWQPLTNPDIARITNFALVPQIVSTAGGVISVFQLDMSITGEVSLIPGSAVRTLRDTIRLRNERP